MRELDRCDFCGADAAGTFEVLPANLEPTDAEQTRVVLCRGCESLVDSLLEPLYDRLGTERPDLTDPPAPEAGDDPETDGRSTDGPDDDPEPNELPSPESDDADEEPRDEAIEIEYDPAGAADESSERPTEAGSDRTAPPRPPAGYGRVLRFLQNRDFPMERAVAETLVAGAYDLDPDAVEAIVEHAITTGEFDQDGEELHRPP